MRSYGDGIQKKDKKIQRVNTTYSISYESLIDKNIKDIRLYAAHNMARATENHALENGYIKFTVDKLNDGGESHMASMVFIHLDDYYELMKRIAKLEGGREIIEEFF